MPFSEKTIQFLIENRLHDSREWFNEHKKEYQALVIAPLQELTVALTPSMLKIDPQLTTEPKVDKTICRIWRDTRYSKDKSRYRENMWIIFKRGKMHGAQVPGLYFEIAPEGFSYGGGFYDASADYMNVLRRMILEGHPAAKEALKAYSQQSVFTLEGECYKRPRFSKEPPERQVWLERRKLSINAYSTDSDLLYSDRLAGKLIEDFALFAPLYRFLLTVSETQKQEDIRRPELLG